VEDIAENEYATVQKSPVVMEIKDDKAPHSVRNYQSVMDLPEEGPERPVNRTSQHSHIGLITSGEMVEIPLQDEKCELLPVSSILSKTVYKISGECYFLFQPQSFQVSYLFKATFIAF
jgi:hypothetical protein